MGAKRGEAREVYSLFRKFSLEVDSNRTVLRHPYSRFQVSYSELEELKKYLNEKSKTVTEDSPEYKELEQVKKNTHHIRLMHKWVYSIFVGCFLSGLRLEELDAFFILFQNSDGMSKQEFIKELRRRDIVTGDRTQQYAYINNLIRKGYLLNTKKRERTKDRGRPSEIIQLDSVKLIRTFRAQGASFSILMKAYSILNEQSLQEEKIAYDIPRRMEFSEPSIFAEASG